MVVSVNKGTPIYDNPHYGDPRKGTGNFGQPPFYPNNGESSGKMEIEMETGGYIGELQHTHIYSYIYVSRSLSLSTVLSRGSSNLGQLSMLI